MVDAYQHRRRSELELQVGPRGVRRAMTRTQDGAACPAPPPIRLGINIDHVATLRNARGGRYPDPLRAAKLAVEAGADNITAHLREDRRHIRDDDIARLTAASFAPLNLEMAVTPRCWRSRLKTKPHASCLVPEQRQEITTEGGLDVAGQVAALNAVRRQAARRAGIQVALFIDADPDQIEASREVGTDAIEIHTGSYCRAATEGDSVPSQRELERIIAGARLAAQSRPRGPCRPRARLR